MQSPTSAIVNILEGLAQAKFFASYNKETYGQLYIYKHGNHLKSKLQHTAT
jgi:hypothetical protein